VRFPRRGRSSRNFRSASAISAKGGHSRKTSPLFHGIESPSVHSALSSFESFRAPCLSSLTSNVIPIFPAHCHSAYLSLCTSFQGAIDPICAINSKQCSGYQSRRIIDRITAHAAQPAPDLFALLAPCAEHRAGRVLHVYGWGSRTPRLRRPSACAAYYCVQHRNAKAQHTRHRCILPCRHTQPPRNAAPRSTSWPSGWRPPQSGP
jgi:hypothetical protein